MIALQTQTLGVMENRDRQHEYLLVVAMLDAAIQGKHNWIVAVTTWFDAACIKDQHLQSLYRSIVSLVADKQHVDTHTLLAALPADGSEFGSRLAELYGLFIDSTSQGCNLLYYAQQVYDAHRRVAASRDIHQVGDDMEKADQPDEVLTDLVTLRTRYAPAPQRRGIESKEAYMELTAKLAGDEPEPACSFGISDLDATVCLKPGSLCTIAAPTSCGKSVLVGQVALRCALNGKRALLFTYEMTHAEMLLRWTASLAGVAFAPRNKRECDAALAKLRVIEGDGLIQIFAGGMTVEGIMAATAACVAAGGVGVVAVDYIQIVPATNTKNISREQQVSHIANGLKRLAMELKVPVVSASQVNDDGKLRESRDIANASDIVLKMEPVSGSSDIAIKVKKNRGGECGREITAAWDRPTFRMMDIPVTRMKNYDSALSGEQDF